MGTIKRIEKFLPTLPPQSASIEIREWLREEFDRIATAANGALEAVDELRAAPRMFLMWDADNINPLDTTDSKVVNYTQGGFLGDVPVEPDQVLGNITIPKDGAYRLTAYIAGSQPSVTQNDTMRLLIDVNGTPIPIVVLDVASNQTDDRTFAATLTRSFDADDVVSMWMDATIDFGIFLILQVSLEISLVTSADSEQQTQMNIKWFP